MRKSLPGHNGCGQEWLSVVAEFDATLATKSRRYAAEKLPLQRKKSSEGEVLGLRFSRLLLQPFSCFDSSTSGKKGS